MAPHCDFWLQHVSCVMMLKFAGISRSPITLRYAPRIAERALSYASLCICDIARDGGLLWNAISSFRKVPLHSRTGLSPVNSNRVSSHGPAQLEWDIVCPTMYRRPGQPLCTQAHLLAGFVKEMCASLLSVSEWALTVYHALLAVYACRNHS